MKTTAYPVSSQSMSALRLVFQEDDLPETFSYIPEVRISIRQQVKLLRSISDAVMLVGLLCEFLLCMSVDYYQTMLGEFTSLVMIAVGLCIGLAFFALAGCIRVVSWEITDQVKKLNLEV